MRHTSQYYFSAEKLQTLLNKFSAPGAEPIPGHVLKGFVFSAGSDAGGNAHIFAFPVYSNQSVQRGGDGDLLVQNFDATLRGCPYPPPCN